MHVYCNRSHMTSQRVKNKKYDTRRCRVAWLLFFTRCDGFHDLLQYTHTGKCYLFVYTIKIQIVYRRVLGYQGKKKNKYGDVDLTSSICVSHMEVTLLYNRLYTIMWLLCAFFIGCWPWSIKGDTHRWRQIHAISRQQAWFFSFRAPKSFNKPFEFLLYKTNREHFSLCVL